MILFLFSLCKKERERKVLKCILHNTGSLNNDVYILLTKQGELVTEQLVVFVCATTGQGDPPDNMKVRHLSRCTLVLFCFCVCV